MVLWYAVYHAASGELVSYGTDVADPLPEGLAVREIGEQPPGRSEMWDTEQIAYVPRPPLPDELPSAPPEETMATVGRSSRRTPRSRRSAAAEAAG